MRIYQLVHNLVERYAPMDEKSKNELMLSSTEAYNKVKEESLLIDMENKDVNTWNAAHPEELKPLLKKNLGQKAIDVCEKWWMRYVFAILFVVLVPKIKAYFFGENQGDEFDDEFGDDAESLESQFRKFQDFQRLSKR